MKRQFLIFLFALSFCSVYSQSVNGKPLTEIDTDYIMIVGTKKLLSSKVTVDIDFGQKTSFIELGKNTQIKDENGKPVEFNSMIDALNFFAKIGFEFVDAYVITTEGQNVYHWIVKKNR